MFLCFIILYPQILLLITPVSIRYKEQSDQTLPPFSSLDHAAKPEFFLFWAFAAGAVLVYVLSFVHTFLENKVVKLLVSLGIASNSIYNTIITTRFH